MSTCSPKLTNDNPVYYVQYAHARTCNVRRNAESVGIELSDVRAGAADEPVRGRPAHRARGVPAHRRHGAPSCARRTGSRTTWRSLAGTYHRWYDAECRIVPKGDEEITAANRTRAWVNEATRIVLANGLRLLGVSAPERM